MSCQVEQIADCGDISTLARALFIPERDDINWLSQCSVSLSSCGNLLSVGFRNRLCLLTTQWISSTDSNTYLISWSGTLPSDITAILTLPICPSQYSSQNGPDWFCIIVGFKNGSIGFYTNTGHLLLLEKLDEKPVMKISCHTGTYGTLPDDIHILFQTSECIIAGSSLFQTLRNAKAQLAKVQAGVQDDYSVDSRSIGIRKWIFTDQDAINDAAVVGLELKNSYDHLLAASTYGGYDTWYRSIPPVNTLILGSGATPYVGFHYALEGGTTPPLQDVARAVANKIKSALPGWLGGGGGSTDSQAAGSEPAVKSEQLSMRSGLFDGARAGSAVAVAPDRRLAAVADNLGRVAVLDVHRGHLVRLFKGYRDAQCAFVQVFDVDNKKPQLSIVKEIKRALFLIIYNPKKGLIDIRLMQRGNRVAVFTATKNGTLIYNTCGLVGAEKNYTHKKLNLPEFQCVLMDPDGKLKKFNIPFFFALDGEHSDRSKDLHALREFRDYVKKTPATADEYEHEVITKASVIKTLDLKKHCIDLIVRKYEIPPKIIMVCLQMFWNTLDGETLNEEEEKTKKYFANLGLVTLFYRQINNQNTDDMKELMSNIYEYLNIEIKLADVEVSCEKEEPMEFHLLEDDNCILERLLNLTQESSYKDQSHTRVTFAENSANTFKEFISCFILEEKTKHIYLKPDTPKDKLANLAADTFKSIFKIKDVKMLTRFVKQSNVEVRDLVKLVIMHIMNMPLDKISIHLIEKFIAVLYYLCSVNEEATNIVYNEMSPWWQDVRDMLVKMPCPLRSMIVAMACKTVGNIFENKCNEVDESAWVSVTKESAKWGILIGKLEDISILSIILMYRDTYTGKSLPKLEVGEMNINLKYIYTRGKGSVTELIAKWLCGMGVEPEAIVTNELMEIHASVHSDSDSEDEDDKPEKVFIQNNKTYVDENPKIFKWVSLLRRQFPLSTSANFILANMCWEYAMDWQKNNTRIDDLNAVFRCLQSISNVHLRLGLFTIIWSTYIKHTFESSCRLVNKVGRLPKDPLCLQEVGFGNVNMTAFLKFTNNYLNSFLECSMATAEQEKTPIQLEKIWEESMPSLVEVAQDTKSVNNDILNLNYQLSCTIYYQCHFNVKFLKPLDSLYDIDYQYIFDALTGNVVSREINMKSSEKVRNPRMKFLTKLVRAAIDTVTCEDGDVTKTNYNNEEYYHWIDNISNLGELWNVDEDFIKRQQVIGLFHMGYDTLADSVLSRLKDPAVALPPLLAITTQRLKRCQEHSPDQPEWIVTVPPHLYKRLQNTPLDTSIPAHPSLATTMLVLQKALRQIDKKTTNPEPDLQQNIKLAKLIIDTCEVLLRRKLTKQYDCCLKLCAIALQNNGSDQMLEFIRMRVMTIQSKKASNGYEEVEYFPQQDELTETGVAKTPRPGTTFQREVRTAHTSGRVPTTATLRSRGVSSTARSRTARSALHTAARISRAATSLASGAPFTSGTPLSLRFLSKDDKHFVAAAKTMFEYIYYCEGDVRKAMDVASQAQKDDNTPDWWWNYSIARCYCTLGMYRNAEDCLRQALKMNKHISIYLRLVAMYVGLNQPLAALEVCKQGLAVFHEYTPLLIEQARIHDQMGNSTLAIKEYRKVALQDPSNMEAIACIAMHNFYNDQPEIALRYYRRLLATSPTGSEIYNNLGLCCLYCNQWDLILACFRQALYYSSSPESRADIWFNLAHVALSTGDISLARRCLQVSLAIQSEHEAARHALRALDARLRVRKLDVNK